MCGILGIVACAGRRPSVEDGAVVRMRDRMMHRGPDGAGLWRAENAVLGHRRLAVIDPTPGGHQPMIAGDGRAALVYNGELYNDNELRADLEREGIVFRTVCDTETVLASLQQWGPAALRRLRGMYALGYVDLRAQQLILARDPLGIKPLYHATARTGAGGSEIVFASEIPALLAHPGVCAHPDLVTLSSYLTTIRTTLGGRTLFAGIGTLMPGEWVVVDLSGQQPKFQHHDWWRGRDPRGAIDNVKTVVEDSIFRHLRADVPTCCLLSGGLDSTVIATVARRHDPALSTYCSGAEGEGEDFEYAAIASHRLGTRHVEAPVNRAMFAERWPEMVEATGLPLSTPNEVAINAVARRLRKDGKVVTLSGEGADELFGGYDAVIEGVTRHVASLSGCHAGQWRARGGAFQLDSNAWVPRSAKSAVLCEPALRATEGDSFLIEWYRGEFERVAAEPDDGDPVQAHLRFGRRVNLAGLLLRLDSATMLESVESRTPLADQVVAHLAELLPISRKCAFDGGGARTKVALREAFAADVPPEIVARPKASFPLPFQSWAVDCAHALKESMFVRDVFSEVAVATVCAQPARLWQLAWPMINLALWGERWWGRGVRG